jgi:hypothetical protein
MGLSREQERAAIILLSAGAGQISLAGGAALIVHGLIDRDTKDLDAFTKSLTDDIEQIASRVSAAFEQAGYTARDETNSPALRRLMVSRSDHNKAGRPARAVQIELGTDYQALPSVPSRLGPMLDVYELGANKILATYDRIRPRDADDIARLVTTLSFDQMLALADSKMVEPLDRPQLAECFRSFGRVHNSEFPSPTSAAAVKQYMHVIASAVQNGTSLSDLGPYQSGPK